MLIPYSRSENYICPREEIALAQVSRPQVFETFFGFNFAL
jgi:hypothetical protein